MSKNSESAGFTAIESILVLAAVLIMGILIVSLILNRDDGELPGIDSDIGISDPVE